MSKQIRVYLQLFLIGVFVLSSSLAQAEKDDVERKLLPYIEVDENLNLLGPYVFINWLSADHILFGTYRIFETQLQNRVKQAVIYDIATKKTSKNLDLGLYSKQLDYLTNRYVDHKKCFSDNTLVSTLPNVRLVRLLKPEHGCIAIEFSTENIHKKSFYYVLLDGSKVRIPAAFYESIGSSAWIQWLNLYVLNDNVPDCISSDGSNCISTKIRMMTPEGKQTLSDIGAVNYIYIRPSRAGLVASLFYDGVFLLSNGARYKIADGYVTEIEVGPDGCQIAFTVGDLANELQTSKLRIMNVCEGFQIAKDANPFKFE